MPVTITANVQNQNLSQFDRSEHAGVGVRALIGSSWGFASTPDLDAASIRAAGEAAAAVAVASGLVAGPPMEFADVVVSDTTWATPVAEDPFSVSLSEKVDLLVDITATAQSVQGIAIATGTGIVRIVCNYQWPFVRRVGCCNSGRFFNAEIGVQHLETSIPDVVRNCFCESRVGCKIALAGHQHGWANPVYIGAGKARIDADGKHIRFFLIRPRLGHTRDHRANVGTATIDFFQHRSTDKDRKRLDLTGHRPV